MKIYLRRLRVQIFYLRKPIINKNDTLLQNSKYIDFFITIRAHRLIEAAYLQPAAAYGLANYVHHLKNIFAFTCNCIFECNKPSVVVAYSIRFQNVYAPITKPYVGNLIGLTVTLSPSCSSSSSSYNIGKTIYRGSVRKKTQRAQNVYRLPLGNMLRIFIHTQS